MTALQPDRDQIATFVGDLLGGDSATLYGPLPVGWLSSLCMDNDRVVATRAFQCPATVDEWPAFLESVTDYLADSAQQALHVYVSPCLQRDDPGPGRRATNAAVSSIPGLWVELDYQSPTHAQQDLPPSLDAVCGFLADLPLEPSHVLSSGSGVHAHWFFREPLRVTSDDEGDIAARLSKAFQRFVRARGRAHGWTFDGTADLARALRVPGTYNMKLKLPAPVLAHTLYRSDLRYSVSELFAMCEREPQKRSHSAPLYPQPSGDTERRIRAALAAGGGWQRGNRDNAAWHVATFMRNKVENATASDALRWLHQLNQESGAPLPDRVLADKVARAWA